MESGLYCWPFFWVFIVIMSESEPNTEWKSFPFVPFAGKCAVSDLNLLGLQLSVRKQGNCVHICIILWHHLPLVSSYRKFCLLTWPLHPWNLSGKQAAILTFFLVQSLRTSVGTRKGPDTSLLCLFNPLLTCFVCASTWGWFSLCPPSVRPWAWSLCFFRQNKKQT